MIKLSNPICWLTLIALWASSATASDAPLNGNDIMQLANLRAYYSGGDRTTTGHVVVTEADGTIRTRSTHMIRLDEVRGGDQSYFVYFSEPTDLEKTTFLVYKHPGKDDERWLYLPKLDIVRRIEAGDKRTHFVGTDLFYEDVSGRHVGADNHTLVSENDSYWIVRSEPKEKAGVEFAWYQSWIHKKTHLAIKIEYHDMTDKVYRRFQVKKVRMVDDIPTSTRIELQDLNTGSTTTLDCLEVTYGRGLDKALFMQRSLRQPPMQWLTVEDKP